MSHKLTILFALLAISLALVGCEKKIEGVPAEKQLSELNEEEQEAFCTYAANTFREMFEGDEFQESMCLSMAAGFAGFADDPVADCEASFEECMAEEGDDDDDIADDEICPSSEELEECDATMEEVHACLTDLLEMQKAEAAKITQYSCEELIDGGKLEEIQEDETEDPESCTAIQEKCPILG